MADLVNQFEVALRDYHEGNGHWSIVDRARQALHAAMAATPAPAPHPDTADAERWRTFIGLPYATRAEWAVNLSLAPVLTSWVDSAAKEKKE